MSHNDTADMDSDDEHDTASTQPASTVSQRRRKQNAIFDAWLASDNGRQAISHKTKEAKLFDVADEQLSLQGLMMRDHEVIKNPRQYQLELFERAKSENTIAVLDTGSGKTLIAVLLLRWIIDQELERRAAGKTPRISFFLVASVTLAYQQFAVLETNLDHKVARVCGADNADYWDKSSWLKLFAENKVIVCTAAILELCLSKGYITIPQTNLLIFDEAHHAKKNHNYARIIKDFYLQEEAESRPRIFGMTASPIDVKADVIQAATELEALLHSKIATATDLSLCDAVNRPKEMLLRYSPLRQSSETSLLQDLKSRFGHIQVFQHFFDRCPVIGLELGSWCADQYAMSKLCEKRLRQYEIATEKLFYARSIRSNRAELDGRLSELRAAVDFTEAKCAIFATSEIEAPMLSPKVVELQRYLSQHFETPSAQRCIVFVDRRDTARLLANLLQKIGPKYMRSAFLTGGNKDRDEDSFSYREQVMTLTKFRKGDVNCLFATSVAEEGLDIPDCNLVIRFDMYKSMIQFVQSRGRARQQNSKFIHMLEAGNSRHDQVVQEVRYQEMAMRRFCEALPADRRLVGNEDCLEALISKEKENQCYVEPSTGAKLTYSTAMVYLANFVSAIPTETDELQHPTYVVGSKGSKFICEVLLPGSGPTPVRSTVGRVSRTKALAKRAAAFQACIELRTRQYLDEHLMPTYQKKLPAMRNALLAVNEKTTNQYLMRTKPLMWDEGKGTLPQELWITTINFPDGLDRPHQPLALLTRARLPALPQFPIYLSDGQESKVTSRPLPIPLSVNENTLKKLTTFTLRVFKDVFSKTFEDDATKFSYWFAPSVTAQLESLTSASETAIDWETIEAVFQNEEYRWTPETPDDFLKDRFLIDKWDGARKFYMTALSSTLKPFDPVPEDAAKHKYNEHILGYSVSLYKKARERAVWNPNQPVMEAEKLLLRRNLLATPDDKENALRTKAYLCPEPLRISVLRPAVVAACVMMPAIIHRFESYLIALEACHIAGIECKPAVALAAMTKDSDNSENEQEGQINFRKGMGDSYERLEFLGDTFLKMATTICTFIHNPREYELDLHVKRMLLLCNKNLFNVGVELKLYEYIRTLAFSRRLWYPKGLKLLEGKGANKEEEHAVIKHGLADKTIADVSEALIGAALLCHDEPGTKWHENQWENAVRAVTKLTTLTQASDPDATVHSMMTWNDYRAAYEKPPYQIGETTASQRDLAEKVEMAHPYRFKYPKLLRVAFIHPSQPFTDERLPNYERLEFLGDALLDMAIISHIFYRYPDKDPQWLTEHKMACVSNKFLGCVCVNLGFHKHLRHAQGALESQITAYVMELLEAERTAGDDRAYWTSVSDPPKCLPDIVESFVGSMFIDSDFDYGVVQDFWDRHMKWYFEDMTIYDGFANQHPCTYLHNMLQTTYGCQDYRLMVKELPALELDQKDVVAVVIIHDEVIAHSKGKSGRYTRIRAAKHATDYIEGLAPFEFRARFGCNCHFDGEGGAPHLSTNQASSIADCSI